MFESITKIKKNYQKIVEKINNCESFYRYYITKKFLNFFIAIFLRDILIESVIEIRISYNEKN